MSRFSLEWDFSEFEGRLGELEKIVYGAIKMALFVSGEQLRGDSVDMVPFDRGFSGGLAGSASTQEAVDEGNNLLSSTVGYNMPYAAKLHEDMTLNIKQRNTQAGQVRSQKYLEKPLRENKEKYGKIIHEEFNNALNAG